MLNRFPNYTQPLPGNQVPDAPPSRNAYQNAYMQIRQVSSETVLYVRRVRGGQRWSLGHTVFTAPDPELRDRWVQSLRHSTEKYSEERPKNLLVFINPFGGRQRGREVYWTQIAPLFELAGVRAHVLETERANHARDYILESDLTGFDGLVCVGGDGMFSELMHGLIGRTQREAGISEHDPEATLQSSSLRIGIIPAGSTDCVCFATVGVNDPITSALHIIIGDSQPLDVCSVHHRKRLLKYSVSLFDLPFVEVYRVTALLFSPENNEEEEKDENEGMETEEETEGSKRKKSSFLSGLCGAPPSRSKWNCDGELVAHTAIHAR
ncbi:UNVERIFIED_CONTAM: hypothetical protein FKN15_060282 [Acipenser sinensis]